MKRQRHVFPTDEIAHIWAHQTQEDARNPRGNFYFSGPTIYSYGSHFPIATHVARGKKKAILITTRGYSVTTSQHCSAVRQAIPASVTRFDVPSIGDNAIDHERNMASFVTESKEYYEKSMRAIRQGTFDLNHAFKQQKLAREYAKFFKVPMPRFSFLPHGKKLEDLKTKIAEREARAEVKSQAKREKEQAQWAERERVRTLELGEKLELWRNGDPNVSSWQLHGASPALRIKGDQVETSLGARVPLDHAKRVLQVVRKVKESGKEFLPNGHTVHIGSYSVDRIETDGTLHAGCHVISWNEIERLAPQLEAA